MKKVNLDNEMTYESVKADKDKSLIERYAELKLDQLNWSLTDIPPEHLKVIKGCGTLGEICWRMVQSHQAKGLFEGLGMEGDQMYKIWYTYYKSIIDKS